MNEAIRVIVGGPAFVGYPERVEVLGADGTAANAPAAVILAKKLLADSLRDENVNGNLSRCATELLSIRFEGFASDDCGPLMKTSADRAIIAR
jgi:hypothetical protein